MATDALVRRLSTLVVVVCLTTLAVTAALVVSPDFRLWAGLGPEDPGLAYVVGDQVDVEPDVFRSSPATLILFARSTCPSCERSRPFFERVVAAAGSRGVPAWLISPGQDEIAERAYGTAVRIDAARVRLVVPGSIRLRSVPTLIAVDASGTITHVWSSEPNAATQTEILDAVAGLAARRVP